MAYPIKNVIDVSNSIASIPPEQKTFGDGMCIYQLESGATPPMADTVSGPYYNSIDVIKVFGSDSVPAKMSQVYFANGYYGNATRFYVCWVPSEGSVIETLTIATSSPYDWYFLLPDTDDADVCEEVAAFIEGQEISRQVLFCTQNPKAFSDSDTSDLGSRLKDKGYNRSMTIFEASKNYTNAAIAGMLSTVTFSAARSIITACNKELKAVTPINLTPAQYVILQNKNYNFYTKLSEIVVNLFRDGRMASGQFIDTMQSTDFLAYRIRYDMLNLFRGTGNIPFTQEGLNLIRTTLNSSCAQIFQAGICGTGFNQLGEQIENGYKITVPSLASIPVADKQKRILRDIKIEFLLSGSIHSIVISNDIEF